MGEVNEGAHLTSLFDACNRVRRAAASGSGAVLEIVAAEARRLTNGQRAWAGRFAGDAVVDVKEAADGGTEVSPPPFGVLALGGPVARAAGFVGAPLFGSGETPEGVVAVATEDGTSLAPAVEAALGQLATVAGLSLETARLTARTQTASRAREALLASISHDLRNPLNTFAMSAGLLRDDIERNELDAKRAASLVQRMERATARMQGLIEDLLEASRVDAGAVEVHPRAERAAQLVADAAATAKAGPNDKGPAVLANPSDEALLVMADRPRTLQLLGKMVAVAAKATGDGGSIHLDVARDGDEAVFTTRAFSAAGKPVNALEEGRGGLALLISHGLASAQRGTFRAEPSGPLTLVLRLPAASK